MIKIFCQKNKIQAISQFVWSICMEDEWNAYCVCAHAFTPLGIQDDCEGVYRWSYKFRKFLEIYLKGRYKQLEFRRAE